MVITKLALPRRTFIRGMGAAVALPFLDAMVPAMQAQSKGAPRFTAIYCGNGAQHVRLDSGHRRRGLRDVAHPEADRGLPQPDGGRHRAGQLPGDRSGGRWRTASARRTGVHELRASEADRRLPTCGPGLRSIKSSPKRSAATRSCRRSRSRSTATTSSARATTATPVRT